MNKFKIAILAGLFLLSNILALQSRAAAPVPTLADDLTNLTPEVQQVALVVRALSTAPDQLTRANSISLDTIAVDFNSLATDLTNATPEPAFNVHLKQCVTDTGNQLTTLKGYVVGGPDTPLQSLTDFLEHQHLESLDRIAGDLNNISEDYANANFTPATTSVPASMITSLAADLRRLANDLPRLTPESLVAGSVYSRSLIPNGPQYNPLFFISTGVRFTSPYSLSINQGTTPTTATLAKNANSTVTFLDMSYYNRYVMHPSTDERFLGDTKWFYDAWKKGPDVALRMGFNFNSGTSSSNLSASTVAGGGDVYLRADVGIPFWRQMHRSWRQQFTLELSGSATTDYNFLEVHPEIFTGFGYQVSFPNVSGVTNGSPGFIFARVGASRIDAPAIINSQSTDTTLMVSAPGGEPVYYDLWVPSAGATVLFAVGDVSLWAEANVYFKSAPAPWNVSIGASLSGQQIVDIFKGGAPQ
jgi:hypothetical protein